MLPIRNFYIDSYVMDVVLDESSDEDHDSVSYHSGDISDGSETTIDNPDDDPDYDPRGRDNQHDDPDYDAESRDDFFEDPDYEPETGDMDDTEEINTVEIEPSPADEPSISAGDQNNQPFVADVPNPEANAVLAAASSMLVPESKPGSSVTRQQVNKSVACSQRNSEDESQCCTICFEPWTSSSEHRLVSLRCGHLFGRSCITRWLKGHNTRCPQCNSRARRSEIRNIYAKAVKVLDSTERDKALRDLAKESEMRRAAEMTAAQERMRHMLAVQECERLKKELMETKKQLQDFRAGLKSCSGMKPEWATSIPVFSLVQTIQLAKNGGCRIVDSSCMLGMILASQPSSNTLFPGYGFRKISTFDMKPSEFVLVHQKAIRDMAFHPNDGLLLTASLDKTLKITNILSNAVVQTYNVPSDAWSCAWDGDNPSIFYGGLRTGEVMVYDIRKTNGYVQELPQHGAKSPVVSLQYLHQPVSPLYKFAGGPLVGKLTDCYFQQKTSNPEDYKMVPLPAPGAVTCLSSIPSGPCLVTCRPSVNNPLVTHTLCDFETTAAGELECVQLKVLEGGRLQSQLTRTKILSHPDKSSSSLVCVGDEQSRGILVWDGSSGECIINLKTGETVLDLCGIRMHNKSYMTALLDKSMLVFTWNGI